MKDGSGKHPECGSTCQTQMNDSSLTASFHTGTRFTSEQGSWRIITQPKVNFYIMRLRCNLVRPSCPLQTIELQPEDGPEPIKHPKLCAQTLNILAVFTAAALMLTAVACIGKKNTNLTSGLWRKVSRRAALISRFQRTDAIAKLLTQLLK